MTRTSRSRSDGTRRGRGHTSPGSARRAATICECQDWLNYKCTGVLVAGGCNVATRWHCDGVDAVTKEVGGKFGGRPTALLEKVRALAPRLRGEISHGEISRGEISGASRAQAGLADLDAKWPSRCVPMGSALGELTAEAAEHLGLPRGTPVVQGGADAFVGLVGLGAAVPGGLGLITGSSHLQVPR